MRRFALAAPDERERFMRAASLDRERYREQFTGVAHECLARLVALAKGGAPE
jgi:hypothetical protein